MTVDDAAALLQLEGRAREFGRWIALTRIELETVVLRLHCCPVLSNAEHLRLHMVDEILAIRDACAVVDARLERMRLLFVRDMMLGADEAFPRTEAT